MNYIYVKKKKYKPRIKRQEHDEEHQRHRTYMCEKTTGTTDELTKSEGEKNKLLFKLN